MSAIKLLALVCVGVGLVFYGLSFSGAPLADNAPERTGELFKQFGQHGLMNGSIGIGVVVMALGAWGIVRELRRGRNR